MQGNASTGNAPGNGHGTQDDDAFLPYQGGLSDLSLRELTLAQLYAAFVRNRLVLGLSVLAGILAALLASFLATPIYQATATLQIEQEAPKVFDQQAEDLTGQRTEADTYLPTQVEILRSRALASEVADSLGYYREPTLFAGMGEAAPPAALGSPAWNRAVVGRIQSGVGAEVRSGTRLIAVSFDSPSPSQAQVIANRYAEQFITTSLERRFEASSYSRKFLANQIEETRKQLEDNERALIAFARDAGITNVGTASSTLGGGDSTLVASTLSKLNDEYGAAKARRILAQERWEQARKSPTMSIPEVLSNSAVQGLVSQRAALQVQLEGERDRRGANYPTVSELSKKIAETNQQISRLAANVLQSIRKEYEVAADQERGMAESVGGLKDERVGEQGRGVQLSILRREADTTRALYDALLARYRELNAASGVTSNNISIIDRAEEPKSPISPKPLVNLAIGALLGLAIGFVLSFVRERFRDNIRSPEDVETRLGLPMLGVMPLAGDDPTEDLKDPKSMMSEAASTLHSMLQMATPHGAPKSLLLTSSRQAEGKTTTSIAIARAFSEAGAKVLLIDADLRRPSVHRQFRMDNKIGLTNVLVGETPPAAAVRATDIAGLSVLTSGPLPPSPPQLLKPQVLRHLMASYGATYDLILIDSPPILGLADVIQLAGAVEAVLFVINAESKSVSQVRASVQRLARANANVIGAVLTKFDFSANRYDGYAYYNYYHYNSEQSGRTE